MARRPRVSPSLLTIADQCSLRFVGTVRGEAAGGPADRRRFRLQDAVVAAACSAHEQAEAAGEAVSAAAEAQRPPPGLRPEEQAAFTTALETYGQIADARPGRLAPGESFPREPSAGGRFELSAKVDLAVRADDGLLEVRRLAFRPAPTALADDARAQATALLLRSEPQLRYAHLDLVGGGVDTHVFDGAARTDAGVALRRLVEQALESTEQPAPTPGPWCGGCGLLARCPIARTRSVAALRGEAGAGPPAETAADGDPSATAVWAGQLAEYAECPRAFANRIELGIPVDPEAELPAEARDVGLLAHAELEARHARSPVCGSAAGGTNGDAAALCTAVPEEHATVVASHLGVHGGVCPSRRGARYLGGEQILACRLPELGAVVLAGIDAIWELPDGAVELRDYKTGAYPRDPATDPAALVHALVGRAHWPDRALRVVYERLACDPVEAGVSADPAFVDAALERVAGHVGGLRGEERQARPGPHCARCGYRWSCPESVAR